MPARKKDPTTRARANRSTTAAALTGSPTRGTAPKLPPRRGADGRIRKWRTETTDWWADLWASPMAAEYHPSDRHALYILAVLIDDYWSAPTPSERNKLAAEIRLQRQAFGQTPYDRLRLEWTFEETDAAKDRGSKRRGRPETTAAQPEAKADPRLALVQ